MDLLEQCPPPILDPDGRASSDPASSSTPPGRQVGRALSVAGRLIDIAVAGTVLLVLSPMLVMIALLIRRGSPGPALFAQERLGRERVPFSLLKFRTMRCDASEDLHREYVQTLIAARPDESHDGLYKLTVDHRITPLGRVLRSWSLDEIPQLINVLRGEMALVGPRPVIAYEAEVYPASYMGRFAVTPGLTGLWQVSGRNERTYDEMIQFDLDYAAQRSLRLDLKILLRTIPVVLRRRGVA
jgi:lipopolysaccharide/colanic/teichoic acid biosynthesis glycosyltransferase